MKKPILFLIGGVGMKNSHIQFLKKNYEALNLDYNYTSVNPFLWCNPKYINFKAKQIHNKILQNPETDFYVHSFSAGFYIHCELMNLKHKSYKASIIESAPTIANSTNLNIFLNKTLKVSVPCFLINKYLNFNNYNDWINMRYKFIKYIDNSLILKGNYDSLLDNNYFNNYIEYSPNKIKKYIFPNSGHSNIYQNDTLKYKEIINNFINENKNSY